MFLPMETLIVDKQAPILVLCFCACLLKGESPYERELKIVRKNIALKGVFCYEDYVKRRLRKGVCICDVHY